MDTTLIIAIATMGGLGFIFAGALALADKKLRVDEDPRIAEINEVLPNANCGGCGCAGCYDFAVKVVNGDVKINGCPVGGQEVVDEIAKILGLESTQSVKLVARILCNGGNLEAVKKEGTEYLGPQSCSVKTIVAGGDKMCLYGCLGGGDCVEACQFGAIFMNDNGLPVVVEELCNGCGQCAEACPRGVIEIHPEDRELFVFCKNHDDPKKSKEVCSVSCFGCAICARKSDGAIEMRDFLPEIDYSKLDLSKIPIDKCKTGAIRLMHPEKAAKIFEEEKIEIKIN
ncbi:MAG: RnfABCDGE type electron transport complex subunit B [Ignavibacteriota bacterium]|nr:RnfABCDGE type electron transport complex subunit B [Ignavibacterium sp.]MCO6448446.1 RnfABCDGE type electron transport complex subunit B [Ignavibacterium album]MCZ2270108.1 RnfABCDGE type electron transport complex subunit B [Ignavibacteriales bacterium]QKK00557.1 MAG: RnfABCDGE type electron transport complex subunit B [Ignavibacteriota bacterium]HMN18475.1 RnfABCDGE type electron transport complex subunit B [Ignavibacteriaceae bacterium]